MKTNEWIAGFLLVLVAVLPACTQRAWYEGFRSSAQHRCQALPSPEYEDCMQQSDVEYGEYEKDREGLD